MFKALLVVVTMLAMNQASATGVAVPTNIVNAPKAQFIGSMVTANGEKTSLVPTSVTPINPQFKDCAACLKWLDGSTVSAAVAKFTSATLQTSWGKTGLIGFVGECVDSNIGNNCAVPE